MRCLPVDHATPWQGVCRGPWPDKGSHPVAGSKQGLRCRPADGSGRTQKQDVARIVRHSRATRKTIRVPV